MLTNIKDFEFFNYGCPATSSDSVYGLYQPTLDCFIVVDPEIEVLKLAKVLLSSRYGLYIIELNKASNYSLNLIDNEICENWSIKNKNNISIGKSMSAVDVIPAAELVTSCPKIEWNVAEEKKWALTVNWWIRLVNNTSHHRYKYMVYDTTLKHMPGIANLDSYRENFYATEQKIYETLYFGTDFDTTLSALENIIINNKHFNDTYYALKNHIRQPDSD